MAHVGRQYKLQFRRDLANVTNNVNAYPEAFRWGMSNAAGPVANDFLNNVVPLINLATDAQPPMVWQSDPRAIAGINYIGKLTITDPFDPQAQKFALEVKDTGSGAILFSYTPPAIVRGYFTSTVSGFANTNFTDSALFRVVAGSFLWSIGALGWNDYNP